jgi:hypothetical protein
MADYVLFGKALLAAAVTAGLTLLLISWPVRMPPPWRVRTGLVFGLGAGIYAGCAVVGHWPRWPALEDRDRFLTVLLPLTLVIELAAESVSLRAIAWLLRCCLAGVIAPILLHNSVYLADLAGPNSAEWTTMQATVILCGLAIVMLLAWGASSLLQARVTDRALSPVLIMVGLATSFTVMLSGYYQGGLMGLPVAGALAGATVAAFATRSQPNNCAPLGIGLVGIFSLLVIGRFFGSLPTSTAACLWLTPLLAWLVEVPPLSKLSPWGKTAARLIVVALPLIVIVVQAQLKFEEDFKARRDPFVLLQVRTRI